MTREAVAIAHDDISDMGLRKSILEMLELEGYDISHIRIDVEDGVVYLSGEVESDEAKEEVDVLINEIIGVEEVSNELTTGLDTNDEIDLESDDGNTSLDTLDEGDDGEEGTTDPSRASDEGIPYIPPDRPFFR